MLLLTAACAELRWHKDGADAASLERDLAECRQQAQAQAERMAMPHAGTGPRIVGVDALGRPIVSQPERLESERFLAEQDLARHCMGLKGYKLVPAKISDGARRGAEQGPRMFSGM